VVSLSTSERTALLYKVRDAAEPIEQKYQDILGDGGEWPEEGGVVKSLHHNFVSEALTAYADALGIEYDLQYETVYDGSPIYAEQVCELVQLCRQIVDFASDAIGEYWAYPDYTWEWVKEQTDLLTSPRDWEIIKAMHFLRLMKVVWKLTKMFAWKAMVGHTGDLNYFKDYIEDYDVVCVSFPPDFHDNDYLLNLLNTKKVKFVMMVGITGQVKTCNPLGWDYFYTSPYGDTCVMGSWCGDFKLLDCAKDFFGTEILDVPICWDYPIGAVYKVSDTIPYGHIVDHENYDCRYKFFDQGVFMETPEMTMLVTFSRFVKFIEFHPCHPSEKWPYNYLYYLCDDYFDANYYCECVGEDPKMCAADYFSRIFGKDKVLSFIRYD